MICVFLLQNCMVFVEGETGSCSEPCDADGFEEVIIKVEQAIYIKDEIPEATSFPPINSELEVTLWGVCEVVVAHAFRSVLVKQGNCEMTPTIPALCYMVGAIYLLKFGLQS